MSKLSTDAKDRPLQPVTIAHCGELERKARKFRLSACPHFLN